MFISDELVFLHLQKAAGTFVVDKLAQVLPGEVRAGHAPLREPSAGRLVAAAIRDPWDWYVSLWSYGCMGRGEVRGRLLQSRSSVVWRALRSTLAGRARPAESWARIRLDRGRDPAAARDMYASVESPERFRRWLRYILTIPTCGHLPDAYPLLPMRGQVGFMTFRVLKLFTGWDAWTEGAHTIRSPDDALAFYRRHGIVDHILRTEHVEEDLDRLLGRLSVTCNAAQPPKANRSNRHCHTFYYDRETIELVLEKERMIVDAFGYAPPELAA